MTPTQSFIAAIITAFMASGAWPVLGPKVVGWKNRKNNAQARQREVERDEWMLESKDAYQRVAKECKDCHTELGRVRDRYEREMGTLRRELAEVKEALLNRIEALDDLVPFLTGLPPDKLAELRAANRAHRQAVFRGKL